MKKTVLFLLFPLLSIGQTQIGSDIDGEAVYDISGRSISLSADGSILAIGAYFNDGNGTDSGAVRVYENVLGSWTQIGSDIDGKIIGENSGWSVSLSGNGNTLAIGAPGNNTNGSSSGSVRVYQNISDNWIQIGSDINGEAANENSGWNVSLSGDGSILAIGVPNNNGNGTDSGAVRIYQNVSGNWIKVGANIDGKTAGDTNGFSVSLSEDGSVLAIGAPNNDGNGTDSGAVRVYQNVLGNWIQIGTDINGEASGENSGWSVSLSGDGNTLAIGAIGNTKNGTNSGSARVYQNVSGSWTQIGSNIDGKAADDFNGISVSLSNDGSILTIGAYGNNGNGPDSGSVQIYKNVSDTWTQIGSDIYGENNGDQSGTCVSLSDDGTILAIGAPGNDGNGNYSGSVRVYDLSTVLSSNSFVLTNFSVYPNPASEFVTISLEEDLKLEKVNVYNTLGQLVKTEKTTTIAVNSFTKGTYFFEIITNKGKAAKTIVVK